MALSSKTPMMVLQELATKQHSSPPEYQIVSQKSGTHENYFNFVVSVLGIQAQGGGPSKQVGKQQAAHNALMQLEQLGLYDPKDDPVTVFKVPLAEDNPSSSYVPALNCIVELQNICLQWKLPPPTFTEVLSVGPAHHKEFTYQCSVASVKMEERAGTKKMAKQLAAKKMLEELKNMYPNIKSEEHAVQKFNSEQSAEALKKYAEIADFSVQDESMFVGDYHKALAQILQLKDMSFDDFKDDLKVPSLDSLQKITTKLGINYEERVLSSRAPFVASLTLKIQAPFTLIARGETLEKAKQKLLREIFELIEDNMQVTL